MQNYVAVKVHKDLVLPEVWLIRTPNELVQLVRYRSIVLGYQSLWEFAQKQKINPNSFRVSLLDLYNNPSPLKTKIIKILVDKLKIERTSAIPPVGKLEIDKEVWLSMSGIQRTALIRLLALHHGFKNLSDLAKHLGFYNFEQFRMFVSRGVNKRVLGRLSNTLQFAFKEKNKPLENFPGFFMLRS